MAGNTNFPTGLDDNTSLYDVTDAVSTLQAAHHNNLKEAVKALEAKVGINHTAVDTTLDFRIGSATGSHNHDGASGMGAPVDIVATSISVPSGGYPSGGTLQDLFMLQPRVLLNSHIQGSAASGANGGLPLSFGKTLQLQSLRGVARRGPSGATATFDINFDATSIWHATQANRLIFPPGASVAVVGALNTVTYPSGAIITVDVDTVGSSAPTEDLSITFVFRESV